MYHTRPIYLPSTFTPWQLCIQNIYIHLCKRDRVNHPTERLFLQPQQISTKKIETRRIHRKERKFKKKREKIRRRRRRRGKNQNRRKSNGPLPVWYLTALFRSPISRPMPIKTFVDPKCQWQLIILRLVSVCKFIISHMKSYKSFLFGFEFLATTIPTISLRISSSYQIVSFRSHIYLSVLGSGSDSWPPDAQTICPSIVKYVWQLLAVFHAQLCLSSGILFFDCCFILLSERLFWYRRLKLASAMGSKVRA